VTETLDMGLVVHSAAALRGTLRLPGDKSIAHRALIANAIAGGPATVTIRSPGNDVQATARCLRALGITIDESTDADDAEIVHFAISGSIGASVRPLDCGNSGTTMRLLAGVVAGAETAATLYGDDSLERRPMERVAAPLREMGARVDTTDGHAPVRVTGRRPLRALDHELPVPSAQILGAISFAALSADGETTVTTPGPTRDHTERLLAWMGLPIERRETTTTVRGPATPTPRSLTVPGDLSAATAWLVAAAVHPNAELRLAGVGLNPTRTAAIDLLRDMGADIEVVPSPDSDEAGPEPTGDITVRCSGRLRSVRIGGERVAELIDELPVLAIAMAAADGTSEVRDADELRVKESDRIATIVAGLAAIGARVEELPDGWRVRPGTPRSAEIATEGDHRIAIAFALAALSGVAGSVWLDDPGSVAVSYPGFWDDVAAVGGNAAVSA
jgi:3-phosphoshikimate 1-carboxyvinyltransferase